MVVFVLALFYKLVVLDFLSSILIVIVYSIIWMIITDRIIIKFALPRAKRKIVYELQRAFRLRKLDPRLAFFLHKWLQSARLGKEREIEPLRAQLKRLEIPLGERAKQRRTSTIAEMYEDMARVSREISAEIERLNRLLRRTRREPRVIEGERARMEEQSIEREREGRQERVLAGAEERGGSAISRSVGEFDVSIPGSFDLLSIIFSRHGKCFLSAVLRLGNFFVRDLADECGKSWRTAKEWVDAALRLGIVAFGDVIGGRRQYRVVPERVREIVSFIRRLEGAGGEG